jgi:hypothetical protein
MKKYFKRFILPLMLLLLSFGNALFAQSTDKELTALILHKDSLFWHAYNTYDIPAMATFFSKDVEFYHDKGGITRGVSDLVNSFKKSLIDNADRFRLRRVAIDSSVKIFPLRNSGIIYGAICSGQQLFYVQEKGKPERADGITRFFHVWLLNNGAWKMARIISYDHQPALAVKK